MKQNDIWMKKAEKRIADFKTRFNTPEEFDLYFKTSLADSMRKTEELEKKVRQGQKKLGIKPAKSFRYEK